MALPDDSSSNLLALQPSGNLLQTVGLFDDTNPTTELALSAGRVLRIPTALLLQQARLDLDTTASSGEAFLAANGDRTIPVLEEHLEISKRIVETGKVTISKKVHEEEEILDVPLVVLKYAVDRVPMNIAVEAIPGVRKEGRTTIYPVVSEQIVVSKKLMLVEEVRVTEVHTVERDNRVVTLLREKVEVTRTSLEGTKAIL
ncbi:MAG: YsnF/AvaK domain-containing protein [Janthinobacterium lividum]